jgi:hypothetical protein
MAQLYDKHISFHLLSLQEVPIFADVFLDHVPKRWHQFLQDLRYLEGRSLVTEALRFVAKGLFKGVSLAIFE